MPGPNATIVGVVPNQLSRLQQISVREIWPHEAHHFTRWLLENADVLSDVLGMQLDLTEAEHKVGGFSLDLIGKDLGTGEVVIVENQLEQTDHGHLGQLLTYAGGTDPRTIVWCAPRFRDEHRAALDWLNEHTDEDTRFFGVEISAVRIDASLPAPLFRLVAQPNDWTKQRHVEKSATLSGKASAYTEFWAKLLERVREDHPDWTSGTATSKLSWITLPYGKTGIWYGLLFTLTGPAVELYFGHSDAATNLAEYEKVVSHRDELEELFGGELQFEPLLDKKASRIRYYRADGGDVLDLENRAELIQWFMSTMERLRPATQHVRSLVATKG